MGCILDGDVEGRQAGGLEVDRRQILKWSVGPVLSVGSHRFLYVLGNTLTLSYMYLNLSVFIVIFSTYSLTYDCT